MMCMFVYVREVGVSGLFRSSVNKESCMEEIVWWERREKEILMGFYIRLARERR